MSFLRISALEKTYTDGTHAVKGVDLEVREGEFIVLLGPSGCGKTSTLRMVAGLELATAGRIELSGTDVTLLPPSQRDVGFVFQFYALYPHLSVRENIAFPLRCTGVPARDVEQRVDQVCAAVGLGGLQKRRPAQLSGGDRQRVALARAMVRKPRVYLMDEPLGTLDADRRLEMCEFIRAQQQQLAVTTLYVTHDQEEAMSLADRIVVMAAGNIRQVGTPAEVYENPADLFVANFVGSPGMNFMTGMLSSSDGQCHFTAQDSQVRIPLGEGAVSARPVTLGVRPEYLRPTANGPITGSVVLDEYLGSHRYTHLQTPSGRMVVRSASKHRVGEQVSFGLSLEHVHLFDSSTDATWGTLVSEPFVTLRGVSKQFGERTALADVDLNLHEEELLVVLGPTGAGKTTLLRTIAGLEQPTRGTLEIGGRNALYLSPAERDVAFVFQNFSLYPDLSARQNMEFPLRAPGRRLAEPAIRERVEWAAALLKIEHLLERKATRLSGGEMQRVAIGRAIVRRPKLFLMDEPLTNLDAKLREALRVELVALRRELGAPMIYVTHDQAEALSMGDRIVVLGNGRVLQTGSPESIYCTPASAEVARQVGQPRINLIALEPQGDNWLTKAGYPLLRRSAGQPQRAITLGVRPEAVLLAGGPHAVTIELVENTGPAQVAVFTWGGERVHALLGKGVPLKVGDAAFPLIQPDSFNIWPQDSVVSHGASTFNGRPAS